MTKLFCDLKTDEEKRAFFLSGRGYETGVIAQSIQNDVAMAYHRCSEYRKELEALQAECEKLRADNSELRAKLEAPINVSYIDGNGAARSKPADCRYGISYVIVADTIYWPLNSDDAQRLHSAECGNGDFTGPVCTAPNVAVLVEALEDIQKAAIRKSIHTDTQAGIALGCIAAICEITLATYRKGAES